MSKMKEAIERLVRDGGEVKVYLSGRGYRLAVIESIDDDVVTIRPNTGNKVVIHYTAFTIERN